MRWPIGWSDSSLLDLVRNSPVDYLLVEQPELAGHLTAIAKSQGLPLQVATAPPKDVQVVSGEWPGTKLSANGVADRASAGPTGDPWIDSNGWKVQLAAALRPEAEVWVDAAPAEPRLFPESYAVGVADAAVQGGRWIVTLDGRSASQIAERQPDSKAVWYRIVAATRFFADDRRPDGLQPAASLGVISDFTGASEFLSHEILNLLARANQQYRILVKSEVSRTSLAGLRAVLYADQEPPSAELQALIGEYVKEGGMVISGPAWGPASGSPEKASDFPRYSVSALGKGRMAIAKQAIDDPYLAAQDAVVLISHRYDLLRFWNGGAIRGRLEIAPDRSKALLRLVLYANARTGDATIRVAGSYRTARLFTLDGPGGRDVSFVAGKEAIELHLPAITQYAEIQLEG